MWQAPNQRLRAQANARKRERDRYKIPFHVKRVTAQVQLLVPGGEPKNLEARALLNDFSPKGMGLFCAHHFSQGDEIVVTIESPEKIQVKGRITWCQEYFVAGKVLKTQSFSYRAGVQFTFATADDALAVKKFCEQLLNTYHCVSLRPEKSTAATVPAATAAPASTQPVAEAAPAVESAPATELAAESAAPQAEASASTEAPATTDPAASGETPAAA